MDFLNMHGQYLFERKHAGEWRSYRIWVVSRCFTTLDATKCLGYGPVICRDGFRVGSHVVSVRIHCTEKWRTSFHTDVLSKSK